jgi:2-iminobutanoate/2-iminopropanoate deaminase
MNLRPMMPAAVLAAALLTGAAQPGRAAEGAPEPIFHPLKGGSAAASPPFSESVRAGDMLYLSGQIGTDASGKLVPGGIRAETRQLMENIGAALARGGSSFANVVQCTVALADIGEWAAFNEVYRGYFGKRYPARMAYATTGLALGARAEVQCIAAVPH